MVVENMVALAPYNTFGILSKAHRLARVGSVAQVQALCAQHDLARAAPFVLGGGSNIVLTGDVHALVIKVEIPGISLVGQTDRHWLVQVGAGENWSAFVDHCLAQGWLGLENLAFIPGTCGGAPVQNIGAYGVELQDRLHEVDAVDLASGQPFTLSNGQCAFGYRDSIFKHPGGNGRLGLAGRALITHVRFALPKRWRAELSYLDLQKKVTETGLTQPSASQVRDWVVAIRRAKLPDPAVIGNVGSFFKNPTVSAEQCADIIGRDPKVVHYPMPDGSFKLAAAWLIDACGWKGKSMGQAAVHDRQALVLVNRGHGSTSATGGEVMTLARAIQTSVYERFGIRLEPEPVVVGHGA